MNREELSQLYTTVILAHNNQPFHFEQRTDLSTMIKANNPICGDRFTIYLEVREEIITEASFYGFGCALSKASVSILLKKIQGMSLSEVRELTTDFLSAENSNLLNDAINTLSILRKHKARIGCIELGWKAIDDWLSGRLEE